MAHISGFVLQTHWKSGSKVIRPSSGQVFIATQWGPVQGERRPGFSLLLFQQRGPLLDSDWLILLSLPWWSCLHEVLFVCVCFAVSLKNNWGLLQQICLCLANVNINLRAASHVKLFSSHLNGSTWVSKANQWVYIVFLKEKERHPHCKNTWSHPVIAVALTEAHFKNKTKQNKPKHDYQADTLGRHLTWSARSDNRGFMWRRPRPLERQQTLLMRSQ